MGYFPGQVEASLGGDLVLAGGSRLLEDLGHWCLLPRLWLGGRKRSSGIAMPWLLIFRSSSSICSPSVSPSLQASCLLLLSYRIVLYRTVRDTVVSQPKKSAK